MGLAKRSSALLLCLGLGLAGTAQAADHGWYVLAFGGPSSASASQNDMDENLSDIFASVGVELQDATSSLDDSDTGFGISGGYQANDHFAFEFGYVDLGSINYQASGTVTDGVDTFDIDARLGSSASGPFVAVHGILPIGERFSVYGRAGLGFLSVDGTARITAEGESQRASQSSQNSDPMFGAGIEYTLSRNFAVRLAWDRFLDAGTNEVAGDSDSDLYSLGIRMGVGWFR